MGTRSNVIIIETGHDKEIELVNIYRQMDGYPSCHGATLAEFISKTRMVNGISLARDKRVERIANGAGCFAAQLIDHLKDGPGNIYIAPPGECDNDYTYKIRINTFNPGQPVNIEVWNWDELLMKGGSQKFTEFCIAKAEVPYEIPL